MAANLIGVCSTMGTKRGSAVATNMNALNAAIVSAGGPALNDLFAMAAWVIAWAGPGGGAGTDPGGGGEGGDSGGGGPE